jgi:hypothetical protein
MKILQKEYDSKIGSNVITTYEKPIYYLYFDDVNESKLDENNPKKMVYVYNQKMADLCNKVKINSVFFCLIKQYLP